MGDAFKDAGPGERSVYDRTGLPDVHVLPEAMTDWAAKVLEGVPRYDAPEQWVISSSEGDMVRISDALAAIARMGAGDGLMERLQDAFNACRPMNGSNELDNAAATISDAIAHIATEAERVAAYEKTRAEAAEARISELVEECNQLEVMARDYAEEAAALRERVARAEALKEAAALMNAAAETCRSHFTYPPKTKEQRDWQTGAIIHSNAARAILALIDEDK